MVTINDGRLQFVADLDLSSFESSLNKLKSTVDGVKVSTEQQTMQLQRFADRASSLVASYFSIQAASSFVQKIIQVRGEFEQLSVAYTTLLGSKQKADQLFAETVQLAKTTPFTLTEVASGTKQLLAYGFSANEVTGTLEKLGNIAAGLKQPLGDIAYLYGTLKVQGRAFTQDIRQFTGRGIDVVSQLAIQFDTTKENVSKLVEAGKVGFPEVEKAVNALTGAGGQFFNLMAKQSQTITGKLSNLEDAFDQVLNKIGESNSGLINDSIDGLLSLVENYQQVLDIVGLLITTYGAYRAALVLINATQKINQLATFGYVAALSEETVAKIANTEATLNQMRAEVSELAVKKDAAIATAASDAALVKSAATRLATARAAAEAAGVDAAATTSSAEAKAVLSAEESLLAAKEQASISRKAALAASSEFYTGKQVLETEAKAASAVATVELTSVEAINAAGKGLLARITAVLNKEAIASIATTAAVTAALTAVAVVIYGLTADLDGYAQAQRDLNDIKNKSIKDTLTETQKLESLQKIIGNVKKSEEDRLTAVTTLREVTGDRLKQYTNEEILLGKLSSKYGEITAALKDYKDQLIQTSRVSAAQSKLQEIQGQLLDVDSVAQGSVQQAFDNIPLRERLGIQTKDALTGRGSYLSGRDEEISVVSQYRAILQQRAKAIEKAYGDQIDNLNAGIQKKTNSSKIQHALDFQNLLKDVVGNFSKLISTSAGREDLKAVQKGLDDALGEENLSNSQIERIKQYQAKVADALKKYSFQADARASKAGETEFDQRKRIYDQIGQLNAAQAAENLTANDKEVADTKAKYDKILTAIDNYNRNAKTKIGKDVINGLNDASDNAQDDVRAKQRLEGDKVGIEAQKQLYQQYEDYKTEYGEEAAKQRFKNETIVYSNYLDFLKSLTPDENDLSPYANKLRDFLKTEIPKAEMEAAKKNAENFTKILVDNQDYYVKRKNMVAVFTKQINDLEEKGFGEAAKNLSRNFTDQLTEFDQQRVKQLDAYRELFNSVNEVTTDAAKRDLKALQAYIDAALKAGTITKQAYEIIAKQIKDTTQAINDRKFDKLLSLAGVFNSIGSEVNKVSNLLGGFVNAIGQAIGAVGQVGKLQNVLANTASTSAQKFEATAGLVTTAVNGVLSLTNLIISSAKDRKAAEDAYYDSVIKQQNQYNLSLIDQIRLQSQLKQNILLGKDYRADILDASKSLAEANKQFGTSLAALSGGQAKTGQKNAVDGNKVLGGLGSGAAAGAAIGAIAGGGVFSIPAAAAGAIIGGVAGAIAGLFGGKKKVDTLAPLLDQYPDLIKTAADGTKTFNSELAKSLIQENRVSESTKTLLQNTLDLNDARQKAIDQINSDIKDLAGSLGSDLRNALVQAFRDGTDAAKAFEGEVDKVIENIVSQFLFQDIFGDQFDKLQEKLKGSFGIGGDQNATDDLTSFFKDASPLIQVYQDALKQVQAAGAANGLNLFSKSGSTSQNSISGSIQAQLTEQTGTIIAGGIKGIQLNTYTIKDLMVQQGLTFGQMLMIAKDSLDLAIKTEQNTRRTADNTESLPDMLDELKGINTNTKGSLATDLRAAGHYGY